ncbi:MAG: transporter [Bacteroidia bacterium]
MKSAILLLLFFLLTASISIAQIETDRPDFTESPNVVPKGALQIETGFIWENDKELILADNFPGAGSWEEKRRNITANTTLLRYGLTKNFELRLNTAFNSTSLTEYTLLNNGNWGPLPTELPDSAFDPLRGFSTSFIGFKTNLYKNDKLSIGFLGHLYIPELASGDFAKANGQNIAPEFLIPLTYDITDKFGIAMQYGLTWDGFTPNPTTSYTLALGYSITDKLSAYVEPYGFLTNNGDELHLINGGFTYLINDDFQVDLTGGFGLNEAAPDNFVNCGASFLLFNK